MANKEKRQDEEEYTYLVLDCTKAVSMIYRKDSNDRYCYWYVKEETWYFMNAAYWDEISKAEVLFKTKDFSKVLPFVNERIKEAVNNLLDNINSGTIVACSPELTRLLLPLIRNTSSSYILYMWRLRMLNSTQSAYNRALSLDRYIKEIA